MSIRITRKGNKARSSPVSLIGERQNNKTKLESTRSSNEVIIYF